MDGIISRKGGELSGLSIKDARKKAVEILEKKGLIEKVDKSYNNSVAVCYKCGSIIEPIVMPNWFIRVDSLKKSAAEAVKSGKVKIYPKWQERKYTRWMEIMHDWPISRQIVWGIRIPAWYSTFDNPNLQVTFLSNKSPVTGKVSELLEKYSFGQIEKGLQTLIAPNDSEYIISINKPGKTYLQETDTFDTWFSSGHWPLVTLGYPNSKDYGYFYPTNVMETGWEILRFWVSRMIMFGIYLTGKPPFKDVYLHGLVRSIDGKKMSKSLGNTIDPLEYVEKYGADALRAGMVAGTATGKDFNFPKDKIVSYRNFANKIWNMARFMQMMFADYDKEVEFYSSKIDSKLKKKDKEILKKLNETIKTVDKSLEIYRFADAAEAIYHFMWDDLASDYIEHVKSRKDKEVALSVLRYAYFASIKLLHPFMPFVTEAVWKELEHLHKKTWLLVNSSWPAKHS